LYPEEEEELRQVSAPIERFTKPAKRLFADLLETVLSQPAVGLAAPQIGEFHRAVAVRLREEAESEEGEEEEEVLGEAFVMVNPEIVEAEGEEREYDACLSIPGLFAYTTRPYRIVVKYLDQWGNAHTDELTGLDARTVLHEIDHLDGVLFLDRIDDPNDLYVVRRGEDGETEYVPYEEATGQAFRVATRTQ
jgi:peptide deformylase